MTFDRNRVILIQYQPKPCFSSLKKNSDIDTVTLFCVVHRATYIDISQVAASRLRAAAPMGANDTGPHASGLRRDLNGLSL